MKTTPQIQTVSLRESLLFFSCICLLALVAAGSLCVAQTPSTAPGAHTQLQTPATEFPQAEVAPTIPPEQLESLLAPIALYPDPLLIQVLAASTYPLEIIQLKQWMDENRKLKGKALGEAVVRQNWDPSVQALSGFPAVLNKLANKIHWTTDLGNAFLAQQDDVMDAVQRLREKAQANGALKTNDKQTVTTETTRSGEQAITIEPAQRDVVYVPTYNTQTVYGDSGYSDYSGYSGYSDSGSGSGYDYSYLGYAAAAAAGAAYGYYWGDYNWRDRYASVNYDNYYNNNYSKNWNNKINNWNNSSNWNNKASNFNNLNRTAANNASRLPTQGQGPWQHDPLHRGNAPYGNSNFASQFGQRNNRFAGGAGNRTFQGPSASTGDQSLQHNLARANSGGPRSGMGPSNVSAPNRVGSRVPSNWPEGARGGAFGPSNGNLARAFSGRGAQSMAPSRMGPPQGLRAGGPPRGGGFHGGPPGGGFPGGPPMGGGFHGGPPMGGGLPPGGAPPPMGGGLPLGGAPPPPPPPGP